MLDLIVRQGRQQYFRSSPWKLFSWLGISASTLGNGNSTIVFNFVWKDAMKRFDTHGNATIEFDGSVIVITPAGQLKVAQAL